MLKTIVIVLTGLLGALVIAGGLAVAALGVQIGDGDPVTQERAVDGAFDRVDARGPGDVELEVRRGAEPSITVHAGSKVIDEVRTRVEAGTLIVEADHGDDAVLEIDVADPRIVVVTPELREAALHGSGDLTVDGLDVDAFTAALDGSGDFVARGHAAALDATLDGSGDLELDGLEAERATVSLDGSGDVAVRATGTLALSLDGSGDIGYAGGAEVIEREIDGSGDVEAR